MLEKNDKKKIEKDVLTEVLRLLDFIMTIVSKLKKNERDSKIKTFKVEHLKNKEFKDVSIFFLFEFFTKRKNN